MVLGPVLAHCWDRPGRTSVQVTLIAAGQDPSCRGWVGNHISPQSDSKLLDRCTGPVRVHHVGNHISPQSDSKRPGAGPGAGPRVGNHLSPQSDSKRYGRRRTKLFMPTSVGNNISPQSDSKTPIPLQGLFGSPRVKADPSDHRWSWPSARSEWAKRPDRPSTENRRVTPALRGA